jgi:octaheme c-type cytochrome (tetrathionate reductase family)
MKLSKYSWMIGLSVTLTILIIPLVLFIPRESTANENPSVHLPVRVPHTDHSALITGQYTTGAEVTQRCLECHAEAATQVMGTTHWTWESEPFDVPWREEPVTIGKANQINNFCIGSQGNQKRCMTCHVGYGWEEYGEYDFSAQYNVDCLSCHADTNVYAKGEYGDPAEGIDLTAAAQSVRYPTRENCGKCHFDGGGGNGVKHGDLDESLYFPSENQDVHMGREDFQCIDCHWTEDHQILGRMVADNYVIDPAEQVQCTNCHSETLHEDARINAHVQSIACQTCHIPSMATKDPTKVYWDWSTSGQDLPEDQHTYLKIKGTFIYEKDFQPTYIWFNGNLDYRYLLGDEIDPNGRTYINKPAGDIRDPQAKIFPFKIHIARQPYDAINNYLLQPITAGADGYWTNFDWDLAFSLAEDVMGLAYSGEYGFAETQMYWPTTHMVVPKEQSLQCADCHSENGRLDWQALGYPGDPMVWGGRGQDQP